nr:MAG TPA: hypothetical protein [Caudoviricetes sp.]
MLSKTTKSHNNSQMDCNTYIFFCKQLLNLYIFL